MDQLTIDQKIEIFKAAMVYSQMVDDHTNRTLCTEEELIAPIKKRYQELCIFILEPVS